MYVFSPGTSAVGVCMTLQFVTNLFPKANFVQIVINLKFNVAERNKYFILTANKKFDFVKKTCQI